MEGVANDPDADLVDACRTRKSGAWVELCARHAGDLYGLALPITRDQSAAEDCVQEALTEAFRKLHQFSGRGRFKAWLSAICRNKARECGRGRRPQLSDPERFDERSDGKHDPLKQATDKELSAQVDLLLRQMSEKRRTAWILRAEQDRSFEEIASILHVSESRARGLFFRARGQLASHLRKHGWGPG